MFTCVLGRWVASTVTYEYPNLSEGAERVGGQLRGDEECLFGGVTSCGRIDPFRSSRCRTATTNQSRLQSSTTPSKRM